MATFRSITEKAKGLGPLRANNLSQSTGKGQKMGDLSSKKKGSNSDILELAAHPLPMASEKPLERPKITIIDYDEQHYHEAEVKEVEECFRFKDRPTVTWINIDGLHQMEVLEKLGSCYGIHPLVLEDILTDQRPKIEDYDDYIFIVLKMLYYDEKGDKKAEERDSGDGEEDEDDLGDTNLDMDQVSMILGPNFIISFKEKEVDVFNPLRDRLRTAKGKIRKQGSDYLAYSMIDAIVDHYFLIMEKLGDRFEDLEDVVVSNPEPGILPTIYNLKRDMLFLRKSVWPLREAISKMQRSDSPLVSEAIKIYLRDVYDHTIQVIENIETFRDMSASLLETYLSSLSNKLNEVIKLLTIISTIFIPLTFLAGLYGMNFRFMPELESPLGYPAVLILMLMVVVIMMVYFRKKEWI
ncbi:MAG: magnesium/cobalt transporter CorA [Methanothrix sp.]|jgi:magnesium transporter|nr:magnesium/cobalt transporter CorA [Methanothrix sp.]